MSNQSIAQTSAEYTAFLMHLINNEAARYIIATPNLEERDRLTAIACNAAIDLQRAYGDAQRQRGIVHKAREAMQTKKGGA